MAEGQRFLHSSTDEEYLLNSSDEDLNEQSPDTNLGEQKQPEQAPKSEFSKTFEIDRLSGSSSNTGSQKNSSDSESQMPRNDPVEEEEEKLTKEKNTGAEEEEVEVYRSCPAPMYNGSGVFNGAGNKLSSQPISEINVIRNFPNQRQTQSQSQSQSQDRAPPGTLRPEPRSESELEPPSEITDLSFEGLVKLVFGW